MTIHQFESVLVEAEKLALVRVIQSHPEWTLDDVLAIATDDHPRATVLLSLTFRELMAAPDTEVAMPDDGGPFVRPGRLAQAKQATGPSFDEYVLAVLTEASAPVQAAYLRSRTCGCVGSRSSLTRGATLPSSRGHSRR
jgi:hypothetical protein